MKRKTEFIVYGSLLGLVVSIFLLLWNRFGSAAYQYAQSRREEFMVTLFHLAPRIIVVLLLFFVFKIISLLLIQVLFKNIISQGDGVKRITRFVLWFGYVLISLSVLFNNFGGLLTSVGLIGFGLTFALQKPISNMMGWLTVLTKGIYKEGDRIQIGDVRGDVKEIQMMNTVLENLLEGTDVKNRKIVTFPNDYVLQYEVKNYTKEENYLLDELKISITYESDYHKAITLLERIVKKQINDNKEAYISRLQKQQRTTAQKQTKAKKINELESEFQPNIRVEFLDSAIELIVHFLSPYDQIKQYRTDINKAFLDAIEHDDKIEIAYPHMQIVYPGKK